MRITESRIRQIIREEIEREMGPEKFDPENPSHRSAMRRHFRGDREDDSRRSSSSSGRFPGMDDDEEGDYLDKLRGDWDKLNRRARDLDEGSFPEEIEGIYGKAPPERGGTPREKLENYLMDHGGDELVDAVMSAVDDALERAMDSGESPTSEDVTFNLSDEMIDMIPQDDENEWHEMLDAVLEDEFDAGDFEDARAAYRDEEETRRDLSHPSRFVPPRGSRY